MFLLNSTSGNCGWYVMILQTQDSLADIYWAFTVLTFSLWSLCLRDLSRHIANPSWGFRNWLCVRRLPSWSSQSKGLATSPATRSLPHRKHSGVWQGPPHPYESHCKRPEASAESYPLQPHKCSAPLHPQLHLWLKFAAWPPATLSLHHLADRSLRLSSLSGPFPILFHWVGIELESPERSQVSVQRCQSGAFANQSKLAGAGRHWWHRFPLFQNMPGNVVAPAPRVMESPQFHGFS